MAKIIAEIALNHNGNMGSAFHLMDAARECGVDAIKFQLHISTIESLKDAPSPPYYTKETHCELFDRTAFSIIEWEFIKEYTGNLGLEFICSPFSIEAVDVLERVRVDAYKIASGEVTNIPLLKRIAETGKPVYLSSGMSDLDELDWAVSNFGDTDLTLMQCSSIYPCPYEMVGLNLIGELKERYDVPVGFSDHTLTNYAAYAAVALGASCIEKHFTLTNEGDGADFWFSILPEQMTELVNGVRAIESMTPVNKDDLSPYGEMKRIFEKSITSTVDIKKGDVITEGMIAVRKPGGGIIPSCYDTLIGQVVSTDIPKDSIIYKGNLV